MSNQRKRERDFDGLVDRYNRYLSGQLRRLEARFYEWPALRSFVRSLNPFCSSSEHPLYTHPDLTDDQKDAVAQASDARRVLQRLDNERWAFYYEQNPDVDPLRLDEHEQTALKADARRRLRAFRRLFYTAG